MKKLLFGVLTAFGIALGANAALGTAETTFENIGNKETADATVTVKSDVDPVDLTLMTGKYWSVDGVGNDVPTPTTSKVTAYEAQGVEKNNVNGGYGEIGNSVETGMTYAPGSNYLSIDADSVLLRKIENTVTLDSTYYIDTMVKFTATDLADGTMMGEIATGEKIVVWMYQPSEAVEGEEIPAPVLKVAAGYIGADKVQGNAVTAVDKKVYTAAGNFQENTWYRLSVKAINNAYEGASAVYFVVCIDGVPLTYIDQKFYDTNNASIFAYPSLAYKSLRSSILPSMVQGNGATTLSGLGFKGNGAVDNILFSDRAPCDSLIDGSTDLLFQAGGKDWATFAEAVDAALAAEKPIITLISDTFKDEKGAETYLSLDFSKSSLTEDKTLVLNLNGMTLKAVGATEDYEGVSIETTAKTLKDEDQSVIGKVIIIDTVGGATVQGKVQGDADIFIGDVSGTYDDKGVTYAGTFEAWNSATYTLCKGRFTSDPIETATVDESATITVAKGYKLVDHTSEGGYWTIEKATTTYTDVTITLGTGIKSATYQIVGDAEAKTITAETKISVAIGASITVTGTADTGYTAADTINVKVSAETKTIEVTATPKNYDLTVTLGEGVASATVKIGEGEAQAVESGKAISVPYNSAVVISATAADGCTINEIAKEDASFYMPAEAKTVKITASGTLVISWEDKAFKSVSYVIGEGTAQQATSGAEISVEVGKTVTITPTVADWYKDPVVPDAFAMRAERKEVEISATIVSGDTAADVGITEGDFASANKAEVTKVVAWAAANKVSRDDVKAMNFTSPGMKEEAYLLNCANTEEKVAEEKAKFKITKVDFDENGKPILTWPNQELYNGTVEKKGSATIGADAVWTEVTEENQGTFKFFRAFLTK